MGLDILTYCGVLTNVILQRVMIVHLFLHLSHCVGPLLLLNLSQLEVVGESVHLFGVPKFLSISAS